MFRFQLPKLVLCHGIPERCFQWHGQPMPICARCLGAGLGQVVALSLVMLFPLPSVVISILLIIPMGIDWFLQQYAGITSNNCRRLTTGLLGGYAVMCLQLRVIFALIDLYF
jgi:uncharacterized membrane protein